MARDSNGTHTLPTGQPVVTGTTISSATFNVLTDDISDEITDSLSRSGKGGMTAALRLANGTVGTPSVAFTNDTAVGIYRKSSGVAGVAAGGSDVAEWSSSGFKINTLDPASLSIPFIVRKTADQSTTSSAMSNVTDMAFTVAASGVYFVEGFIFLLNSAAQFVYADFTGPAAPTRIQGDGAYVTASNALRHMNPGPSGFSSAFTICDNVSASHLPFTFQMIIENGANSGTAQMRFRNTDNVNNLTIYRNSILRVTRLV